MKVVLFKNTATTLVLNKISRRGLKKVSTKLWPETAASNFFSFLMEPELSPEQLHTQALMVIL